MNENKTEFTEEMNSEKHKLSNPEEPAKVRFTKKRIFSFVVRIGIIAAVIGIAVFLILFNTMSGDIVLLLSPQEVTSDNDAEDSVSFKSNSKLYFFIAPKSGNISSDRVILEIHFEKKGQFFHYKQISYEIDKNFKKLRSFIPEDYFMRPGKYRIDVFFDNNRKISREFVVEK